MERNDEIIFEQHEIRLKNKFLFSHYQSLSLAIHNLQCSPYLSDLPQSLFHKENVLAPVTVPYKTHFYCLLGIHSAQAHADAY